MTTPARGGWEEARPRRRGCHQRPAPHPQQAAQTRARRRPTRRAPQRHHLCCHATAAERRRARKDRTWTRRRTRSNASAPKRPPISPCVSSQRSDGPPSLIEQAWIRVAREALGPEAVSCRSIGWRTQPRLGVAADDRRRWASSCMAPLAITGCSMSDVRMDVEDPSGCIWKSGSKDVSTVKVRIRSLSWLWQRPSQFIALVNLDYYDFLVVPLCRLLCE